MTYADYGIDPKIITHIVTATAPSGRRSIVSRHSSEALALRAVKLAKGNADYRVQTLNEFFA